MNERIPYSIRPFLTSYTAKLHELFPEQVRAVFLIGSAALGALSDKHSDIDCLVALARPIYGADIARLKTLHRELRRQESLGAKLDVVYCDASLPYDGSRRCPTFVRGQWKGKQRIPQIALLELKTVGIELFGSESREGIPEVNWERVRLEMAWNLNQYWGRRALLQPWRFWLDEPVELAVLTLCRIVYTLENHAVLSKRDAARWALQRLPGEWHPLIREALRIRYGGNSSSEFSSRWERLLAVRRFILEIRDDCGEKHFALNRADTNPNITLSGGES
jgi:predicted nucleotidyltransferase